MVDFSQCDQVTVVKQQSKIQEIKETIKTAITTSVAKLTFCRGSSLIQMPKVYKLVISEIMVVCP